MIDSVGSISKMCIFYTLIITDGVYQQYIEFLLCIFTGSRRYNVSLFNVRTLSLSNQDCRTNG